MSEIDHIIDTLKDTYEGNAWHGPSAKEILSKISENQQDAKIGNGHSIIEIILHMNAWRNFVIQILLGNDSYQVTDELNFPQGQNLKEAIRILDKSQEELIATIAKFDEQNLHQEVPKRKYSYHKLLHGIIHHDLYHLGQIVMIIKQF